MIYFALYNVLLCILDIIMICLILHQLGRKHVWSPGRGNKKGSSSQMQQGFLGIKYFVIGAKGCVQHWILIWSWIWLHSWPVCMIPTAFCLVQSPKRIKQEKLSLPYFRPFFSLVLFRTLVHHYSFPSFVLYTKCSQTVLKWSKMHPLGHKSYNSCFRGPLTDYLWLFFQAIPSLRIFDTTVSFFCMLA